jgi:hypothetical protein
MKKAAKRRAAEPSAAALREMPELDFSNGDWRPNPYAARLAAEGRFHTAPGRPRKGTETGATVPRSIRFPAPVWRELEKRAKAEGITLHAALRAAVVAWMKQDQAAH